ncbi:MAG: FKBP-type peptidyl-prolyl cis-trans isomerase [Bacteroidota bacterium]
MIRIVFVVLVSVLCACDIPVQERHVPEPDPVREEFVKVNRYMQRRHQDHIAAFVKRVGWSAEVTPSGLWIVVEEQGTGPRIETGSRVTYAFSSTLLDGTPVYESPEGTPKQVQIGQGGVESGVEEGLGHLRSGGRAILLIPPHLAHGNFGDGNKIPGNSVLIYRLDIKEVR